MQNLVGKQVGNYKLIRKLGRGGFADVYLGEHIYLGSEAAIKVLRELSDAEKELFRTEGRNLVRLVHPNIVRLLEFGFDHNTPYLVMDYAPNKSLREKCPLGTRLSLTTVVAYVKQLADALQYAHDQKLIHRDVKPENMLLGRNNEIVLSDFGISIVAYSTLTVRVEEARGTIYYMAPEQLKKKSRPASDQYSLAVVVYSWLTGTLPFTGDFIEVLIQQLTDPPPSLRTIDPAIPVAVEQVILKALEKNYLQRYETIQAFAQALELACQPDSEIPVTEVNSRSRSQSSSAGPVVAPPPQKQASAEPVVVAPPKKTKEQWLNEGYKFYGTQKYKMAIEAFNQAIAIDSEYPDAYFNRGLAYEALDEHQKAISDYSQSIALDEQNFRAYIRRGTIYNTRAFKNRDRGNPHQAAKDHQRALEDFGRAIALNPQYAIAYYNRGLTYSALRKYQEAIDDYDWAIELNSQNANYFNNRGYAYQKLQKYQKAIEDYDSALAIDPHHTLARNNRVEAFNLLHGRL